MNNMHTVFVYGTLQQGCSNHILLAGSTCLGPAVTEDAFVLRTLVDERGHRGIPFVGRDLPIGPVHGEVYLVDDRTLAELDRLEGCVPDDPEASWSSPAAGAGSRRSSVLPYVAGVLWLLAFGVFSAVAASSARSHPVQRSARFSLNASRSAQTPASSDTGAAPVGWPKELSKKVLGAAEPDCGLQLRRRRPLPFPFGLFRRGRDDDGGVFFPGVGIGPGLAACSC